MLTKFEELALIARCVTADDRRAFGRLVEEYQDGLRRFLYNLTGGDSIRTDDLAQETFLKAYSSLQNFKGIARFKTWLYRIAYNEFYSSERKNRGEDMAPLDNLPMANEIHCDNTAIELRHDIEIGLKALSPPERTAILLFYMEDLPIKKIASIMSMPEGSIKSYLSRARIKMGRAMSK